jgi:hypothetical protein
MKTNFVTNYQHVISEALRSFVNHYTVNDNPSSPIIDFLGLSAEATTPEQRIEIYGSFFMSFLGQMKFYSEDKIPDILFKDFRHGQTELYLTAIKRRFLSDSYDSISESSPYQGMVAKFTSNVKQDYELTPTGTKILTISFTLCTSNYTFTLTKKNPAFTNADVFSMVPQMIASLIISIGSSNLERVIESTSQSFADMVQSDITYHYMDSALVSFVKSE